MRDRQCKRMLVCIYEETRVKNDAENTGKRKKEVLRKNELRMKITKK